MSPNVAHMPREETHTRNVAVPIGLKLAATHLQLILTIFLSLCCMQAYKNDMQSLAILCIFSQKRQLIYIYFFQICVKLELDRHFLLSYYPLARKFRAYSSFCSVDQTYRLPHL